jgi:hypothetical protein
MMNRAPIQRAILEENPAVLKKVEYLTSDTDAKATAAISELSGIISTEHIQKASFNRPSRKKTESKDGPYPLVNYSDRRHDFKTAP